LTKGGYIETSPRDRQNRLDSFYLTNIKKT
jgi:hypothetical protein